jgi:hypothetical protein
MPVCDPAWGADKYRAMCRCSDCPPLIRKTGLGTLIANALSAIGYTKERHIAIKKTLRLSPTCGCDKREAWLNGI